LERLLQIADVVLASRDAGVIGAVQHIGHDQGGQHTNDEQHHHQLDQGEAALDQAAQSDRW